MTGPPAPPLSGLGPEPGKLLGAPWSLCSRSACAPCWPPLSSSWLSALNKQTHMSSLTPPRCSELEHNKDPEVLYESTKAFLKPKCPYSPAKTSVFAKDRNTPCSNYIFWETVTFQMHPGSARKFAAWPRLGLAVGSWEEQNPHAHWHCVRAAQPPCGFIQMAAHSRGALLLPPQLAWDPPWAASPEGFLPPVWGWAGDHRLRRGRLSLHFHGPWRAPDLAGISQRVVWRSHSLAAGQLPLLSRSNLGIHVNEQNIERDTPAHFRGAQSRPTEAVPQQECGGGILQQDVYSLGFRGGLSWQERPNLIIKKLSVSFKISTTTTTFSPLPKQDKSPVKQFLVVCAHTCAGEKNLPGSWPPLPAAAAAPPCPAAAPLPHSQLGLIFCCLESVKITGFSFCMHNIHFPSKCVIWFGNYIYLQE